MRHCSASATLKHTEQNRTWSLTRCRAAASRCTSAVSDCSRWNASRCALLGPMPGSRPSSSIRSWIAPSYIGGSEARQAEAADQRLERLHLLLVQVLGRLGGVVQ